MKITEEFRRQLREEMRLQKSGGHSKIKVHLNVMDALLARIDELENPIRLFGPVPGRRKDRLEVIG